MTPQILSTGTFLRFSRLRLIPPDSARSPGFSRPIDPPDSLDCYFAQILSSSSRPAVGRIVGLDAFLTCLSRVQEARLTSLSGESTACTSAISQILTTASSPEPLLRCLAAPPGPGLGDTGLGRSTTVLWRGSVSVTQPTWFLHMKAKEPRVPRLDAVRGRLLSGLIRAGVVPCPPHNRPGRARHHCHHSLQPPA